MLKSLHGRLALVLVLLLLAFGGAMFLITRHANELYHEEVSQKLSSSIAMYIRDHLPLMDRTGKPDPAQLDALFHMLMVVNPNVEAYLLDAQGQVRGHAQPDARLARRSVGLVPLQQFLNGARLPLRADDPKSPDATRIFSAAPLLANGQTTGYVYVVLTGEDRRDLAERLAGGYSLATLGVLLGGALLLAMVVGVGLFMALTRPLRALTAEVDALAHAAPSGSTDSVASARDEISRLTQAFHAMATRISEQIQTIQQKDRQRRDMVAAVSHDLRTPLTSLRGYLDLLERKLDKLAEADRLRYVSVAARQCRKLCRLSDELFQLAKLECDEVQAIVEPFPLLDLVQDVVQKFELIAQQRGVRLHAQVQPGAEQVRADIGLIERVLVNLLDNALRHTQQGGAVNIRADRDGTRVSVRVSDTGEGIAPDLLARLFDRDFLAARRDPARPWGGLGLAIAQRILRLHDTDIQVQSAHGRGAEFRFYLPLAAC
ncbi:MAG: HAMP domain-containing sensor histidine kinase [Thiobacillus sp.]